MKLSEWRGTRQVTFELPSGLTVTITLRVRVADLAAQGRVPTPLVGAVNELLAGKPLSVETVEQFKEYGEVLTLVARAAILDPPVVDGVGDDEHLGLDELTVDDKVEIFNHVHGEADKLLPFRPQPRGDGRIGPDGEEVRAEAQPGVGH